MRLPEKLLGALPHGGRISAWQLAPLAKRRRDHLYLAWGPVVLMIDLPTRMFRPKPVPIQAFDLIGVRGKQ